MGTASTMACIAEALGMSLPGTAAIPAVHSARLVAAEESGKTAVHLAQHPITPSQVITSQSVENAFRVLMALGRFDQCRHSFNCHCWEARHPYLNGPPQRALG